MKKRFYYAGIIFLISIILLSLSGCAKKTTENNTKTEEQGDPGYVANADRSMRTIEAKVLEVILPDDKYKPFTYDATRLKVKILKGKYKGLELTTPVYINTHLAAADTVTYYINPILKPGDKVYVNLYNVDGKISGVTEQYVRTPYLILLALLFLAGLIIVGGVWKGIRTMISLGITVCTVFLIFVPAVMQGYNPIIMGVLTCILITVVDLIFICGFTYKSLVTMVGCMGGVLVACLLAFIFGNLMHMTGISNENAMTFAYYNAYYHGTYVFDFKGLLFATTMIGALGAIMDTSISIASPMHELASASPDISVKSLIKSGMNVGKDAMGTMSNTLILAYAGGYLPLILIYYKMPVAFFGYINHETIAAEVIQSFAGSIGIIFAIPLTAFICGYFHGKGKLTATSKTMLAFANWWKSKTKALFAKKKSSVEN